MQPKDIYKGHKVARKFLQADSIKMQYESAFKSDRWCSCYTCLPQTAPATAQTNLKMDAPGTGTESPPVAQRLLTNTWPKIRQ